MTPEAFLAAAIAEIDKAMEAGLDQLAGSLIDVGYQPQDIEKVIKQSRLGNGEARAEMLLKVRRFCEHRARGSTAQ